MMKFLVDVSALRAFCFVRRASGGFATGRGCASLSGLSRLATATLFLANFFCCSLVHGQSGEPPRGDDALTEGLVDELLKKDGESNATEEPTKTNPLVAIHQDMLQVSKWLMKGDVGKKNQEKQRGILEQLDILIKAIDESQRDESAKQAEKSQGGATTAKPKEGNEGEKKQDQGIPGQTSDNQRSDESTGKTEGKAKMRDFGDDVKIDLDDIERKKGVWGHLPERARKEMQASPVTEFLPKYRKWIQDYYRKLSEDEKKDR